MTGWWIEVFGGSPTYTEDLGGYERMLAHHRGLGITPEQRLRSATLISLAADDASLPDDPEFRAALMGFVKWGTRLAPHNSRPGATVTEHAPVRGGAGGGTALSAARASLTIQQGERRSTGFGHLALLDHPRRPARGRLGSTRYAAAVA